MQAVELAKADTSKLKWQACSLFVNHKWGKVGLRLCSALPYKLGTEDLDTRIVG